MMDKASFVEIYCNRPDDSEEIKETRAWLKANVLPHMIEATKEGKNSYEFYIDNTENRSRNIYNVLRENGYFISWWPVAKRPGYPVNQMVFRIYW